MPPHCSPNHGTGIPHSATHYHISTLFKSFRDPHPTEICLRADDVVFECPVLQFLSCTDVGEILLFCSLLFVLNTLADLVRDIATLKPCVTHSEALPAIHFEVFNGFP